MGISPEVIGSPKRNKSENMGLLVDQDGTMPDLRDVVAFCRVVDLGSVTAAARSLGESKGAVSRRVSRLEARLGIPLLRRYGRRVAPTEAGQVYREDAGAALDALTGAAERLRASEETPRGRLRVTAPQGIGSLFLGEVLPSFLADHPEVGVELLLTDAVLSFRAQRLDVALRFSDGLPDSSLVAHRLLTLAPGLYAAPEYLRRRGTPSLPEDLDGHDLLLVPLLPDGQRARFAGPDGVVVERHLRGRVLSHDALLLRELALAGAGITGMLPRRAEPDVAAGRLCPVLPDWRLVSATSLYLLHEGGPLAPKVRVFRDHLKRALG